MVTIPKMIFFHIGWMKHYEGPADDDPTLGSHKYLQDNKFGDECFNFISRHGNCFGHVPTNIDISRLGAERTDDFVDDVVCVWIARDPERDLIVVVGWYSAARIFHYSNHQASPSGNTLGHRNIQYHAVAPSVKCSLIPVSRRTFEVPTHHDVKGGLGQSTVWYGGEDDKFRGQVWRYIKSWEDRKSGKKSQSTASGNPRYGRNIDPEQRKKIETVAVDIATEFFRSHAGGAYQVVSKEKDNVGWDLEASRPDRVTLLIEVKGLSGADVSVQLTPNEYEKMTSETHRENYVLFVVTNCLGPCPMTYDYRFEDGCWKDADGRELRIIERRAAICSSK